MSKKYNGKISRWNIRRTVFQYFKKLIACTENSNSPIAVPVGLIFLLAAFFDRVKITGLNISSNI